VSTAPAAEPLTLFSLQRPDVIASPWALHARLRTEAPVLFDPFLRCWVLSRHRDVAAVLADPRFSVVMDHEVRAARLPAGEDALRRAMRALDRHVSFMDPPAHGRVRGALAAPFAPRHVALLERYVAEVVSASLMRFATVADPDVVADLASRVPLLVIQRMLGLEAVDLETLRRWSTAWGDVVAAPGHVPTGDRARVMADVDELVEALERLVAEHRRDGERDTVTAALVRATAAGELTEQELLANLMMMVTAGNETTGNLIGSAIMALVEAPERWEQLRADRSLLPVAVEELARVHPPTQYTARRASEDVTIDGHQVERGQSVVVLLAAANRDPEVFDAPDELRFDRPNVRRHVAFGGGPHFCFGAPLARLEVRSVLDGLLDGGRPTLAGPARWRLNANLRGLDSLPVRWSPALSPHPSPRSSA
jgi:cytochrome P450